MPKKILVISCLFSISTVGCVVAQESALDLQSRRVERTPDLCQGDVPNGRNFCGPAAVSNGLVWLSLAGYPDLFDAGDDPKREQIKLVQKLASAKYMNTKAGTGVASLAVGLEKYLKERGVRKYRFEYEGWRSYSKNTKRISRAPRLQTITTVLKKNSAVFLNIGRYKKVDGDYHRYGGHWLTLVGAENGGLQLYDPGSRNGSDKKLHEVTFTSIKGGNLKGEKKGMPLAAKGYLMLGKSRIAKNKEELIIVDGILYLTVEDKLVKQDRSDQVPAR